MRNDAKSAGSAVGICTCRSVVRASPPYAWQRSIAAFGADRNASDTFTRTGKNADPFGPSAPSTIC
jgi:hypothetical protein